MTGTRAVAYTSSSAYAESAAVFHRLSTLILCWYYYVIFIDFYVANDSDP